jgi:hypothetical protein
LGAFGEGCPKGLVIWAVMQFSHFLGYLPITFSIQYISLKEHHQKRYCWRSLKCARLTFGTSVNIRFVSALVLAKTDFAISIKSAQEPNGMKLGKFKS